MPKKIVFLISSLKAGGAERVATTLANGLISNYEIILLVIGKNAGFYPLNSQVRVIELDLQYNTHSIFQAIKANIYRISAIYTQLKQLRPHLCVSFLTHTNILAVPISKSLKIPIIVTEHGIYMGLKEKLWRVLRRVSYPYANAVCVLTKADSENYSFIKNLIVLPNPIELPKVETDTPINAHGKYFFSAGRLIASKQFDKLLNAFALFLKHKKTNEYTLKIAGSGSELPFLKTLAKELNIDNQVEFLGQIKNLAPYYTRAYCFILASRQEGFGNVLVESLLCDTPVIAFDCPYGPSEIITQDNGILVPLNDIEALSEAMVRLTENDILYQHLKENAISSVEKFTTKIVIEKWSRLIAHYAL